jgi:hypothetical protein
LWDADPAQMLAHQRRANFRSDFNAFEFVSIREIRVKVPFDFSSFRAENF